MVRQKNIAYQLCTANTGMLSLGHSKTDVENLISLRSFLLCSCKKLLTLIHYHGLWTLPGAHTDSASYLCIPDKIPAQLCVIFLQRGPPSGHQASSICSFPIRYLITALNDGRVIPAGIYKLLMLIGLREPKMLQQLSFSCYFLCIGWILPCNSHAS